MGDHNKRLQYFHWLDISNIDIALLQETFITSKNVSKICREWGGKSYHCLSDSPHSKGVSVLIKKGLHMNIRNNFKSNDGRIIIVILIFLKKFTQYVTFMPLIKLMKRKFSLTMPMSF